MSEKKMIRVLFVCLGNICRSPAAEAVFLHQLKERDMSDWVDVESAGTGAWHVGNSPDERMREAGEKRGYQFLSTANQFQVSDFDTYDVIVTMDNQNYSDVCCLARTELDRKKVHKMSDFVGEACDFIPDPYYGEVEGFDRVLDLVEKGSRELISQLANRQLPE